MDRKEIVRGLTNQGQLHLAFEGDVCDFWVWSNKVKITVLRVKSKDIFNFKKKVQELGRNKQLLEYVKTAVLGVIEQSA